MGVLQLVALVQMGNCVIQDATHHFQYWPSDAEVRMLWENFVNTIGADALAPSFSRSSTAMVWTM